MADRPEKGEEDQTDQRMLELADRMVTPVVVLFILSELMQYMGWPYWKPVLLFTLVLVILQSAMTFHYADKGSWKRRMSMGFFVVLFLLAAFVLLASQNWL